LREFLPSPPENCPGIEKRRNVKSRKYSLISADVRVLPTLQKVGYYSDFVLVMDFFLIGI